MTHIDDDTLVDLALGGTDATTVDGHFGDSSDSREQHLAQCAACRERLDALRRTVSLVGTADSEELSTPSPQVWEAVVSELGVDLPGPPADADEPDRPGEHETPEATPLRARHTRTVSARWLLVAAAVGLVAGVLVGRPWVTEDSPGTAQPRTVASAPLDTLGDGRQLGRASVLRADDELDLAVSAESLRARGGYLEVWLINRDLRRMVSVGVLPADGRRHRFPVSQRLLDQGYVVVDVSREQFDDRPEHSGDSLVRGELEL